MKATIRLSANLDKPLDNVGIPGKYADWLIPIDSVRDSPNHV